MVNDPKGLRVKVRARQQEAHDICSFELVPEATDALPAFTAGAHIDVKLPNGLTRQYSLCNSPFQRHRYQIAVLKCPASRGGSSAMHEQVAVGDTIEISRPRNHFELIEGACKSILVAGGIGITPILSMAEHLYAVGADFELHYCARNAPRAAFHAQLAQGPYSARVHFHFSEGNTAARLAWMARLAAAQAGSHLYVCGPQAFMDGVFAAALAQGWAAHQLHREHFGAAQTSPPSHQQGFEVMATRSRKRVVVPPGRSVVQALAECGIEVPVSCEQGVCGTCVTRVLEGVPEHRDMFLTPEEQARNDQFTPCCSRSVSPCLVLDL